MNTVSIDLVNRKGMRLTVSTKVPYRHVAHENAARDDVELAVNADAEHGKYGPWTATSSQFVD